MKFHPLGERVLVDPEDREEVSPGGIIMPENVSNNVIKGKVLAIGPEVENLPDGAEIIFNKNLSIDVVVGENKYVLIDAKNIFGYVEVE